jgi:hypothetical protein
MLFILFCLIMRTAYQGVQFDLMLREVRPRDVKTIEELSEKNYTVFGSQTMKEATMHMKVNFRFVDSSEH